jgi:hypothetical protein
MTGPPLPTGDAVAPDGASVTLGVGTGATGVSVDSAATAGVSVDSAAAASGDPVDGADNNSTMGGRVVVVSPTMGDGAAVPPPVPPELEPYVGR